MRFKDIIDKKIAINCRTKEEAKKLFEYVINGFEILNVSLLIHSWENYKENSCYRFSYFGYYGNNKINWGFCKKSYYEEKGYKIITLDDLEDFATQIVISPSVSFEDLKKIFQKPRLLSSCNLMPSLKITDFFTVNKKKKTLFLKIGTDEITIKCHEEDKFDWKIGLGLALSQLNAIDKNKAKWHREYFRNKKTHKLDYKKYANWVLVEYYKNSYEDIENLKNRVENQQDNKKIYL